VVDSIHPPRWYNLMPQQSTPPSYLCEFVCCYNKYTCVSYIYVYCLTYCVFYTSNPLTPTRHSVNSPGLFKIILTALLQGNLLWWPWLTSPKTNQQCMSVLFMFACTIYPAMPVYNVIVWHECLFVLLLRMVWYVPCSNLYARGFTWTTLHENPRHQARKHTTHHIY
jgi:hypothetical protein